MDFINWNIAERLGGIPRVKRQERETYVGWINLTKDEDECVGIGSLTVHLHKLTATGNLVGRLHQHLRNASRRQEPWETFSLK